MKERATGEAGFPTDPRCHSVIQASAGTGKTWLLIGRLIRLLLAGASPGSILAITFTRKAAGEIQLRLRQRLLAMCEADDERLRTMLTELGADGRPAELTQARELYEKVLTDPYPLRATTFHAFCQEVLQRFPLEAGVPPGFALLENTAELEAAAFRALDADLAAARAPIDRAMDTLLAECGGLSNTWHALKDFLAHRSDWWAYTEDRPELVEFARRELRRELNVDPALDPRERLSTDPALRNDIADYLSTLAGQPVGKHQAALACLEQALLPDTRPEGFYRLLKRALHTEKGEPRQFKPSKALIDALGAERVQMVVAQHARLLSRLEAAVEQYRRFRTFRRTHAWHTVGQRLLEHFQRLKREQDLLDFADLEWCTYRLISRGRHAEWVQYKLDQRIDHLLVDEFQDTNPTQWRLLLPLLQEMAAGSADRSRSVFLVGDAKQSIYRFRRADPALFDLARDWLTHHSGARVYEQQISWRSSPAVIGFVNTMFAPRADVDSPDARVEALDFTLQNFQPHETHRTELWGKAELLPLVPRDIATADSAPAFRNPLQQPRMLEEDQRHRREGERIATLINSLIGTAIGQPPRPLRYGDIMILLRDRAHAGAYETALRDAHIPYLGAGRGTFLDCLEVRDVLHLLTLLVTPFDDVALATVLRSPLFAASNDDLAALADATATPAWYQRLLQLARTLDPSTPLARAARLLPKWRAVADRIPAHDLLDRIYFEGDLPRRYESAAPAHLKMRVRANLTRLLDLALDADSGRFPSLIRFVERLETLTSEDTESLGAVEEGDAVRLLTIHAAKGLESPVVFLADSARQMLSARERGARAIVDWPIAASRPTLFLLAGAKADADDITRAALKRQTSAALREEANLLYVALTRAQQLLYVSGCEPNTRAKEHSRAGDSNRGWYGFVERCLARTEATAGWNKNEIPHPDGDAIFNIVGHLAYGSPPIVPVATTRALSSLPVDPALTRPFPETTSRRTKVQPSHAGEVASDIADIHALHEARERGIAIHRMLQLLAEAPAERLAIKRRVAGEFKSRIDGPTFEECWQEACAVIDDESLRALFDPARYCDAHSEIPILYRSNGIEVAGVIDRLIVRDDELILVDYKTDRVTGADAPALAKKYIPQLRLYAEGVQRLWPNRRTEALLVFTACRRSIKVDIG
jgi:ATP-dependent helicase/nuclease subunit A